MSSKAGNAIWRYVKWRDCAARRKWNRQTSSDCFNPNPNSVLGHPCLGHNCAKRRERAKWWGRGVYWDLKSGRARKGTPVPTIDRVLSFNGCTTAWVQSSVFPDCVQREQESLGGAWGSSVVISVSLWWAAEKRCCSIKKKKKKSVSTGRTALKAYKRDVIHVLFSVLTYQLPFETEVLFTHPHSICICKQAHTHTHTPMCAFLLYAEQIAPF